MHEKGHINTFVAEITLILVHNAYITHSITQYHNERNEHYTNERFQAPEEELTTLYDKLKRYEALHVVFNDRFQFIPNELLSGIHQFYGETQYPITIERDFDVKNLRKGHCYMAISERDLAIILKEMHRRSWEPHEDIGLLSFDDTPLKELLAGGITTISTDFARMGETAAQLITQGKTRRIANPWVLHDRGSL